MPVVGGGGPDNQLLQMIHTREGSHLQMSKVPLSWIMIASLITITVLRGKGKESIIGVTRCEPADWALLGLLVLIGIGLTLRAVKVLGSEYE
jgi:hypothetical protein